MRLPKRPFLPGNTINLNVSKQFDRFLTMFPLIFKSKGTG